MDFSYSTKIGTLFGFNFLDFISTTCDVWLNPIFRSQNKSWAKLDIKTFQRATQRICRMAEDKGEGKII